MPVLDHKNLILETKAETFSVQNFHSLLAGIRTDIKLSVDYRSGTSESVVYSLMPEREGLAWGRRFFDLSRFSSMLEPLSEAVAIVSEKHSEEDSINIIKAFFLKRPEMRSDPLVLNVLLYAIKKPEIFKQDACDAMRRVLGIKFTSNHFSKTKQKYFSDESSELLVPADASVSSMEMHDIPEKYQASLSLVCTVNPRATEINGRLNDLFASFKEQVVAGDVSSIELASFLHTGIIKIHPYTDGNGRVARALMNHVLKQDDIGPFVHKINALKEHEYDSAAALNDELHFAEWIKTQAQQQLEERHLQEQRQQRKIQIKKNPKSTEARNSFNLCKAARDGNIDGIQEIILANAGLDLSMPAPGAKNYTPLHYACQLGKYDSAKFLLDAGADPLMTNDAGKTAFSLIKNTKIKAELEECWRGNAHAKTHVEKCVTKITEVRAAEEHDDDKQRADVSTTERGGFLIASSQSPSSNNKEEIPLGHDDEVEISTRTAHIPTVIDRKKMGL